MSAPHLEKIAQQICALVSQQATADFGVVIEPGLGKQVDHTAACAGLWIRGTKYDSRYAGMHHGSSAHRAWFERDIETGAGQAVVAKTLRSRPQCANFSVSRRIMMRNGRIAAFTDDLAIKDHHGTDRHFSLRAASAGKFQRPPHAPFIHGYIGLRFSHADVVPDHHLG